MANGVAHAHAASNWERFSPRRLRMNFMFCYRAQKSPGSFYYRNFVCGKEERLRFSFMHSSPHRHKEDNRYHDYANKHTTSSKMEREWESIIGREVNFTLPPTHARWYLHRQHLPKNAFDICKQQQLLAWCWENSVSIAFLLPFFFISPFFSPHANIK